MIGSLNGQIILKRDKFIILENAGIGYKVYITPETMLGLKDREGLMLFIYTHVREDALDLYGFKEYEELEFFEMLIGVSGIGPKGALGILGVASIGTLTKAIKTNDLGYLTKISGIGKKTAEKMILELRDKLGDEGEATLREELDAMEALKSLGYSQAEAREALKQVSAQDTNTKVREALKILGKK